jgi:hypothetical protein
MKAEASSAPAPRFIKCLWLSIEGLLPVLAHVNGKRISR